ncbi:MAG: hypothetical protein AAF960_24205 [Bacteroidota bacterium]
MKNLFRQLILWAGCAVCSYAQVPFDCNGRSFRVIKHGEGTYLQEMQRQGEKGKLTFNNLHYFPQTEINAIAYHPSQHVIYGILQEKPLKLCRIDAAFQLEVLQPLPLPEELSFVSGDISPDQ